jgi:hypothetical protein
MLSALTPHHTTPAIPTANIAAITRENFEIEVLNIIDRCPYRRLGSGGHVGGFRL